MNREVRFQVGDTEHTLRATAGVFFRLCEVHGYDLAKLTDGFDRGDTVMVQRVLLELLNRPRPEANGSQKKMSMEDLQALLDAGDITAYRARDLALEAIRLGCVQDPKGVAPAPAETPSAPTA